MSDNTLCFTGMSREDEAAIMATFEQSNARLPIRFVITPEADAKVVVIDMDSIYGHMTWLKQHASGKTLVALTSGASAETELLLSRPVSVDSLTALLAQISGQTASAMAISRNTAQQAAMSAAPARTTGQQPAVPAATIRSTGQQPAMPAATVRSTGQQPAMPAAAVRNTGQQPALDPEAVRITAPQPSVAPVPAAPPRDPRLSDYLAPGVLGWPVKLQLADAPLLVLDPNSQTYVGSATLKPLLPYVQAIVRKEDLVPVDAAELVQLRAGQGGPQPFQRLAWLLGYAGGNGVLLPGFDINAKFQLSKWPQTEREFPKHFRLATVMMKGPAKLTEIAEQSGAMLSEVIDFVNANLVTGMAIAEGGAPVIDLARASSLLGARA